MSDKEMHTNMNNDFGMETFSGKFIGLLNAAMDIVPKIDIADIAWSLSKEFLAYFNMLSRDAIRCNDAK